MSNGEWKANTTSTDRVFLDDLAINRTLDDIITQGLYEEWQDLGLSDRLYPPEWRHMVENRVERAVDGRATEDND